MTDHHNHDSHDHGAERETIGAAVTSGHDDHAHGAGHSHGSGHSHDHGHGHDHEHATGVWGVVKSIFAPHSHDAADSVDSALESSAAGIRAVKISLLVLGITALVQVAIVVVSGSVALAADTIHNFSDALTAVPLWIAFALGARPASRRFTYGYGRVEDLAGVFVVAMITLSAIVAGYEAIDRLIHPHVIEHVGWVALAGLVGFIGNEWVAIYRIRVGRRIGSAALVADGIHARTDGFTSLAVLIGAAGVALGFPLADPIIGLVITVAILAVLRSAVRDVFIRLLDGVDPAVVDSAERVLAAQPGVRAVHSVRMRWLGHRLHADAELDVDPGLSLAQAHRIAHDAEHELIHAVPKLTTALIHAYPADDPQSNPAAVHRAHAEAPHEHAH
ncbi:cation diffusion facilitator family transporter [Mycobacterium sp. 852013-50091_SCH5140682]|uniref:cation diffusion facilitator family transporter n=1 Tax=Mycobacterium sp. 852013-50091_SCH5140682 TaxID=1834109 RepID=UPI0009EE5CB0|nr:cation diffusion facilitator family transporter [Mycobacterium sp. 852013-50091_SCH5140682]